MSGNRPPSQSDRLADGSWMAAEGDLEDYLSRHDVLAPEETSMVDVEDAEAGLRRIDEEAVERRVLDGKWVLRRPPRAVDDLWRRLEALIDDTELYRVKVTTAFGNRLNHDDEHVIWVYTPNYVDRDDVFRARAVLREECDVDETIYYRPEIYEREDRPRSDGPSGAYRYSA